MKKQKCNHCESVFDEAFTACPTCGRDDALMYPFESMPQHTPGPWTAPSAGIYTETGKMIAAVADPRMAKQACAPGGHPNMDEGHANARLIAAAPELLEALESLLNQNMAGVDLSARDRHELCKAAAVIQKARGE